MNPSARTIASGLALLSTLALLAVGCGTPARKPAAWNLSLTKKTPASIEVDVVGVTEDEKRFYEGLAMDDYWKSGSQVRRDADKLSQILQKDQPWVVANTDAKWRQWMNRGVKDLVVIANLPVKNGLWKITLPLDEKSWDSKSEDVKKDTLKIDVLETRIVIQTPQKARN
jgi:hypothetical protein